MNLTTQSPCSTFSSGTYSPGLQTFHTIRESNNGSLRKLLPPKRSILLCGDCWRHVVPSFQALIQHYAVLSIFICDQFNFLPRKWFGVKICSCFDLFGILSARPSPQHHGRKMAALTALVGCHILTFDCNSGLANQDAGALVTPKRPKMNSNTHRRVT